MTIKDLYCMPKTIDRHCQPPLGSYLDGFQEWMSAKKFSVSTMIRHVTYVTLFSEYLKKRRIENLNEIQQKHIDRFVRQLDEAAHSGAQPWLWAIHRFEQYLCDKGIKKTEKLPVSANDVLLSQYLQWLEDDRNLCPSSIALRRQYLTQFFEFSSKKSISNQLAALKPDKLQSCFLGYIKTAGLSARRSMQATLRTFLTFCYLKKITQQDLSAAIPTLHIYRLSQLPRALEDKAAKAVFNLIDRTTPVGKRDYAIIQVLYHYGIRGGQLRALNMTDIDWRSGVIQFPTLKCGKSVVMPLIDEVGDAVLEYLQYSRPREYYPQIFLTSRAPFRPLQRSSTLSEIIARYLRQIPLETPRGAHRYRHGFATRALKEGVPLKSIADCLGHKCIGSTMIYAKVDYRRLQSVTLEIPGGVL